MAQRIRITDLDASFSLLVRTLCDWKCTRCGTYYGEGSERSKRGLHASHFWGRANYRVRYDLDNVTAHCHGCHSFLTSHPIEHTRWKREQLGEKRFEDLNKRANWPRTKKVDMKLIDLWVKQELKKLGL